MALAACTNRSKIRGSTSAAMPMPVSRTDTTSWAASSSSLTISCSSALAESSGTGVDRSAGIRRISAIIVALAEPFEDRLAQVGWTPGPESSTASTSSCGDRRSEQRIRPPSGTNLNALPSRFITARCSLSGSTAATISSTVPCASSSPTNWTIESRVMRARVVGA